MIIDRRFTGKLNTDTHPARVPSGDFIQALNITRDSQVNGGDGPISNIVGNRLVLMDFPEGSNKCIGAKDDRLRNRIIYFVWNENGYHRILSWDKSSRTITIIFESRTHSADVDILNLQVLFKVKDIDIIHRDEDGDLLLWNDGFNRPGAININDFIARVYGDNVPAYAIRLAKQPPLDALLPEYDSDGSVRSNNLKRKLFQFKYRWVYKDAYKSTWSPISKVILPTDAYTVDVESDPTRNNVIYLQLTSGGVDCVAIEIAMRESVGAAWGDFVLVDTILLSDYGIPTGSTYTYKFLNDGAYPALDVRESDLLFDYVPDIANSQVLINGNVLAYAGITDGYDPIKRTDVNVQLSSILVDSNRSGTEPANPTITAVLGRSNGKWVIDIYIGASVGNGTQYRVKFKQPIYRGDDLFVDVSYTATGSDTRDTVRDQLTSLIMAAAVGFPLFVETHADGHLKVRNDQNPFSNNNYQFEDVLVSATALILKTGGQPTWKWSSKYVFGLVYFDQYGKTNGVVSFVSSFDDPNDFSVTTADFDISTTPDITQYQPKLPVIIASINHTPPAWAVRFQWVRAERQGASSFVQTISAKVESDANYWYFGIYNFDKYKLDNTGFVPSYVFEEGDRVRVMGQITDLANMDYSTQLYSDDYEILGIVEREISSEPQANGRFLKVAKPTTNKPYVDNLLLEIYRPSIRSGESSQVFYEFGESYPIYNIGNSRYHVGEDQNQTASQPATFTFEDGDVYYKFRNFYTASNTLFQVGIMDENYSDFFPSAVNSNGRPNVVDKNVKRLYYPVLIRHGQPTQQGTDINGLNRFYPEDFDEYTRSYGDVMKMIAWNNSIIVFQKYKIGAVPVLQTMMFNQDSSSNLVTSSELINRIQYFKGEYGVGEVPESIAYNNDAVYGWDNNRGVCWRLSQAGLDPISIQNNINVTAVQETSSRGFQYKIYGVFDSYTNIYLSAFEGVPGIAARTIAWNENENGFEGDRSFYPEMMCCLNNLLVTWVNGQLYTHDSTLYNNFYGSFWPSEITVVLNEGPYLRKEWFNVQQLATYPWDVNVSTNEYAYNEEPQTARILNTLFKRLEGVYSAAFPRTNNSAVGEQILKGAIMTMKLSTQNVSGFVFLDSISVGVTESPLNPKQ